MTDFPAESELPFVSSSRVDDFLSLMRRRQPEGELVEGARLKLLDEFDDIFQHMDLSVYTHMAGVREELVHIGFEMTHTLEFVSGLKIGQPVMAGRGSEFITIHRPSGDYEFGQISQYGQMHGQIVGIEAGAFNYDLTPITTDIVPAGMVCKPLLLLRDIFSIDEETAEVIDYPESDYDFLLPLDDETLDLRKSIVLHEPHKNTL